MTDSELAFIEIKYGELFICALVFIQTIMS